MTKDVATESSTEGQKLHRSNAGTELSDDGAVRDRVAFDIPEGDYRFVATYLHEPKGSALIEIVRDGAVVRSLLWPAYKIWNIAAHASDIAAEMERGLSVAGSDGLGGNCYAGNGES